MGMAQSGGSLENDLLVYQRGSVTKTYLSEMSREVTGDEKMVLVGHSLIF
jgi:hypothetical protein